MKARVKATGEIVDVIHSHNFTSGRGVMKKIYKDQLGNEYFDNELEFLQEGEYIPDYWEKLLHQYAGMAMQGILSNQNIGADVAYMVNLSIEVANALVEKLKKK